MHNQEMVYAFPVTTKHSYFTLFIYAIPLVNTYIQLDMNIYSLNEQLLQLLLRY